MIAKNLNTRADESMRGGNLFRRSLSSLGCFQIRWLWCFTLALGCALSISAAEPNTLSAAEKSIGWELLFDGRSLDGWRASDAPGSYAIEGGWIEMRLLERDTDGNVKGTFSVCDGELIVHGPRSHLFYVGQIHSHVWKNFEFSADVKTYPKANSGVYFHTQWQETDFPNHGFEVQVNNSHRDPKRTAGLYDISDNLRAVAKDGEWFTLRIRVEGKYVMVSVDNHIVTEWTQPENFVPPPNHPQRVIDSGTFALQGHDPNSEVHYRNLKVRPLP